MGKINIGESMSKREIDKNKNMKNGIQLLKAA